MLFWTALLATASLLSAAAAVNRPVYKVILAQKGYTQFVRYDVEIPPIREFTFCIWVKLYSVQNAQSIFSYIVNGNNRVVRLWLDSGGYHLMVLLNGREMSRVPVDLAVDTWRHICLSYQSDYGAWALYLDSRLVGCEASQAFQYFVIPGGGSVILGYGITEQGISAGLEGEIFGAHMILTSTIARNHTIKGDLRYAQKTFQRNKIRATVNGDYVVLDHLDTDETHHVAKGSKLPPKFNESISFIKVQTPYSSVKHTIGAHFGTMQSTRAESHESDMIKFVMNHKQQQKGNKLNSAKHHFPTEKYKVSPEMELSSADTHDFAMLSELETPPPLHPKYMEPNLTPETQTYYNDNDAQYVQPLHKHKDANYVLRHKQQSYYNNLPDKEIPPPPVKDTKVYGQWTSSKYAGNVLNYLKSINFHQNNKYKVLPTIPLTKTSNDFPYPLNFNSRVVRPTSLKNKDIYAENHLHGKYHQVPVKRIQRKKREVRQQEINVKVLKEYSRSKILSSHSKIRPFHVDIVPRGKPQGKMVGETKNHRLPRNNHDINIQFNKGSMFNELPFLKSFEYYTGVGDGDSRLSRHSNDMYANSFANANKWHNIKTYNNDYTPRRMPEADSEHNQSSPHPAIRLKNVPENHKTIKENNDDTIAKEIQLASDVSNNSDGRVSILKYNKGSLPGYSEVANNKKPHVKVPHTTNRGNFHKHVKIGNALDESKIISNNEGAQKNSFLEGDEKVPDINRYRSDIDNVKNTHVPPSLKPTVCRNVELLDHQLHVHPGGSLKLSKIATKNIAFEFILQNFKKCLLDGSPLESDSLLLIDWNKTPVRLFGGAVARRTIIHWTRGKKITDCMKRV